MHTGRKIQHVFVVLIDAEIFFRVNKNGKHMVHIVKFDGILTGAREGDFDRTAMYLRLDFLVKRTNRHAFKRLFGRDDKRCFTV